MGDDRDLLAPMRAIAPAWATDRPEARAEQARIVALLEAATGG